MMIREMRRALTLLGLVAGLGGATAQVAPGAKPAASMPSAAQALVDRTVAAGTVPGMVLALGRGDAPARFASAGAIAFDAGAPRAGPDSLWRVYSMTKPITAAAAMILIEEGKLKLDEPLATYIPAFATMRVLVDPAKGGETRLATRPITIRHLLTHTAGFGYFSPANRTALEQAYVDRGIVPLTISRSFENTIRPIRAPTLAGFAQRLAEQPLLFEPGTEWRYSVSLDLMGRVIEVASGMPFDRFVTTRIFAPLGMRSSFWTVPAGERARLATNYTDAKNNRTALDPGATSLWLSPPSFPYGGAGLVMSARDYDTFLRMLQENGAVDGRRILKPATIALMTSNLLPAGVVFGNVNGTGRSTAPGGPTGFGAGGSVYLAAGPGGFPGRGTYGWGGAAGSVGWVDREHHTRGVMMVNVMGGIPGLREAAQTALIADAQRRR